VHPAMTAAAQYLTMTATTVTIATGITAAVAAAIARDAIRQCVWGVLMSVPHATSRSAATVLSNAKIAKKSSVRIV
jgi:hypothetical protein